MPCDRCEANRELRIDAEMYKREAQKERDAANARIAALEAALLALRWSSHDGGCFEPAAKVAHEWFSREPCMRQHNERCLQARAALAGEGQG